MIDKCLYKRIQDKKKELEASKHLVPEDFKTHMLVDFIYNSLAIEGGSLTREQVRKIIMGEIK